LKSRRGEEKSKTNSRFQSTNLFYIPDQGQKWDKTDEEKKKEEKKRSDAERGFLLLKSSVEDRAQRKFRGSCVVQDRGRRKKKRKKRSPAHNDAMLCLPCRCRSSAKGGKGGEKTGAVLGFDNHPGREKRENDDPLIPFVFESTRRAKERRNKKKMWSVSCQRRKRKRERGDRHPYTFFTLTMPGMLGGKKLMKSDCELNRAEKGKKKKGGRGMSCSGFP